MSTPLEAVPADPAMVQAAQVRTPDRSVQRQPRPAERVGRPVAAVRAALISDLLARFLTEEDGFALWMCIRDVCGRAVDATSVDLYLHNFNHLHHAKPRGLQLLVPDDTPERHKFRRFVSLRDRSHIAAQAAQDGVPVVRSINGNLAELAIPVRGRIDGMAAPLAVVVVRIRTRVARDLEKARASLVGLLDQIWPVCTYASVRLVAPDLHDLRIDAVIASVLEGLCGIWGFELAAISLVDEDRKEIRTLAAKGEAREWLHLAHHPLDPEDGKLDIQAWVVRHGQVKVIQGPNELLDLGIFNAYGHEGLVRVFLPLGNGQRIGTIEAGFRKRGDGRDRIHPMLVDALTRYARFDVTPAIQQALFYERGQRHLHILQQLHDIARELQASAVVQTERAWLGLVTRAAQALFGTRNEPDPLVLLHPLERMERGDAASPLARRFAMPIYAGELKGGWHLKPANDAGNIVQVIADEGSYFRADADSDRLLVGAFDGSTLLPFTRAQRVHSFAGTPLQAQDDLLGVLCLNYRKRRNFSSFDQQMIELFAQQVATILLNQRQVRSQERSQIAHDLHDAVKSHVMSIHRFLRVAAQAMPEAVERMAEVRDCFDEIRHTTSGILLGVELIRNDFRFSGDGPGVPLRSVLEEDLKSFQKQTAALLTYDVAPDLPSFPLRLQMTIVWLVEQAVVNAIQHADADNISVRVSYNEQELRLAITDDGRGFDPAAVRDRPHRGLSIMDERAREIGGSVAIDSSPAGKGTGATVIVIVPLKEDEDAL